MSLLTCQNSQNIHQQWTIMYTLDFVWFCVNVSSLIITNIPLWWGDIGSGRGGVSGAEAYVNSTFSNQLYCEPTTTFKNKVY